MSIHLCNAVWLVRSLPLWYFEALGAQAGMLSAVPIVGTFGLVYGLTFGMLRRQRGLLRFLLSVVASQIYVAVAGIFRGQLRGSALIVPTWGFLLLQLAFIVLLTIRLKGSRRAATALGVFCLTYALEAVFIGGMSFADDWL